MISDQKKELFPSPFPLFRLSVLPVVDAEPAAIQPHERQVQGGLQGNLLRRQGRGRQNQGTLSCNHSCGKLAEQEQ